MMEAAIVLKLLKTQDCDTLISLAADELTKEIDYTSYPITTRKRQHALDEYLSGAGCHLYAYEDDGYQTITNGYSAVFLEKNHLEITRTGHSGMDISAFLRDPPGEEVKVAWKKLLMEIALHKANSRIVSPLYVWVGRVCVDAALLARVRMILGGDEVLLYQQGKLDALQLEGENGRALVLPAIPDSAKDQNIIDVTDPAT